MSHAKETTLFVDFFQKRVHNAVKRCSCCIFKNKLIFLYGLIYCRYFMMRYKDFLGNFGVSSRKHTYIILTPLNPTFI